MSARVGSSKPGGLAAPPPVGRGLLPFSLVMQAIGWALAWLVNPLVFGLYGAGVVWIGLVFNRLYLHAERSGAQLGFTELEAFDTLEKRRRWGMMAQLGMLIMAWCAAVLATGSHLRARDTVFAAVYYGGVSVLLAFALRRARVRRRLAAERRALVARMGASDATPDRVTNAGAVSVQ